MEHLKSDHIVPKSAKVLALMLKERLGEEVASKYLRNRNSGYLNHKYMCGAARKDDFSAIQLAPRKTEAHQREPALNNVNLNVFRQWTVYAIREFPSSSGVFLASV